MCKQEFEDYSSVEERATATCVYCGNGADKVFLPAAVTMPPGFVELMRSDVGMTLEECRAQDRANEAYVPPRTAPTFEETMKAELKRRGIRHPERLGSR